MYLYVCVDIYVSFMCVYIIDFNMLVGRHFPPWQNLNFEWAAVCLTGSMMEDFCLRLR